MVSEGEREYLNAV